MSQKNQNRKQHYVPQFYLRFFSESRNSIGNYIIKLDKTIYNSKIANTAQKAYLYAKDKNDLELEKFLGELEVEFKLSLNKIIHGLKVPDSFSDPKNYAYMLLFFSIQIARTKYSADNVEETINFLGKPWLEMEIDNNKSLSESEKDKLKKTMDDFKFKAEIPNAIPLKVMVKRTNFFIDLETTLFVSSTNLQFVTSDVPIVAYNYVARKLNYIANASSIIHQGLMLLLPLSPKIVLMLYDRSYYYFEKKVFLKTSKDMRHINELIIRNAYSNVFFNQNIPKAQLKSLIKLIKKVKHNQLEEKTIMSEANGNNKMYHVQKHYIHELIHVPKMKLTTVGLNVIPPKHMGWLLRTENPYIKEFDRNQYKSSKKYFVSKKPNDKH